MNDKIAAALRIAKAGAGVVEGLPEDAPVPRNWEEAQKLITAQRAANYDASLIPLRAEEAGILNSPEYQAQRAEQMKAESFNPTRLSSMRPVDTNPGAQFNIPEFKTPLMRANETERVVDLARDIENKNARGELGAALKNTWPVQAAEDVWNAAKAPKQVMTGELDPNSELAIKRMFDLSGTLTFGSLPIAKADPAKAGIFGGVGAETANKGLLQQAQHAHSLGLPEKDIWQGTGWWLAPDGNWKFEIPDQAMTLTGPDDYIKNLRAERDRLRRAHDRVPATEKGKIFEQYHDVSAKLREAEWGTIPLSAVVAHPQLFEAYPQLKDLRVKFQDLPEGTHGYHQPATEGSAGYIAINKNMTPEQQRSVISHEVQHRVQDIEGFAKGANPSQFNWPAPMRNRLADEEDALFQALQIQEMMQKQGITFNDAANLIMRNNEGKINQKALEYAAADPERVKNVLKMVQEVHGLAKGNGYEGYNRVMGEVEARNVQGRLGMLPEGPDDSIAHQFNRIRENINLKKSPGETMDIPASQQLRGAPEDLPGMSAAPAMSAAPEPPPRNLSPIGLYSHGAESATLLPQAKGSPQQFKAMLERAGVKPDEMKGFEEAFAGQKSITREQAAEFFNERMPKVEETIRRATPEAETELDAMGEFIDRASKDRELYERMYKDDPNKPRWEDTTPDDRVMYMSFDAPEYASDWVRMNQEEFKPPKFADYTLPGSTNYREVLLRLPPQKPELKIPDFSKWSVETVSDNPYVGQREIIIRDENGRQISRRSGYRGTDQEALEGAAHQRANRQYQEDSKASELFQSSHWDEPNVLAHLRMADRTGPNGERILHLEEIQSDWAQRGRKEGFKTSMDPDLKKEYDQLKSIPRERQTEEQYKRLLELDKINSQTEGAVASAPYVTNTTQWTDLALKRALKEAVDGGYDQMIITPGQVQADRYDLSKHIKEIEYIKKPEGNYSIGVVGKNGEYVDIPNANSMSLKQIEETFGKEIAEKIKNEEGRKYRGHEGFLLEGIDLRVGGEGMKSFYDRIVPTRLKELLRKIDPSVKVGPAKIESAGEKKYELVLPNGKVVHEANTEKELQAHMKNFPGATIRKPEMDMLSIPITPRLREAVKRGLPAFKRGGKVSRTKIEPVDVSSTLKLTRPFGPDAAQSAVKLARSMNGAK